MKVMTGMHRQKGAALVIGLVLLLVLTVLAVSGMTSSSMELVMAGNEQFRQKSVQAADAGLEKALTILPTVKQSCTPIEIANEGTKDPDAPNDKYVVTAQYRGDGSPPSGFSLGEYTAIHYQVVSSGNSSRNTKAENTQGALIIQSTGGGFSVGCKDFGILSGGATP
jgi:type IV pilus assembly protein PilX